ncbi:MAG: hypothetical protein ACRD96_11315 [Bryobacteraceae bacterium]
MIPDWRERFNRNFTEAKYHSLCARMRERCGVEIPFHISETPCFFPKSLLDRMAAIGKEVTHRLVADAAYLEAADRAIPAAYRAAGASDRPLFVQADFAIDARREPRLIELQGFPSLYAFQVALNEQYRESYGLEGGYLAGERDLASYQQRLRRAILGQCDPENVVLLEVFPERQKTRADFALTEALAGIRTVCVTRVEREGRRLYYTRDGRRTPIHRIYNRVIAEEFDGVESAFRFSDEVDVEWAGHPNWFFRLSKFSLPYLDHAAVPRSWFPAGEIPRDLERCVLKPLYSFAGRGVRISPSHEEVAAAGDGFLLQERVDYAPLVDTPHGPAKVEVRIVYIWDGDLIAGPPIVRLTRGEQMGVDFNHEPWTGASAAFYPMS